jgi:hypothetical protein
LARSSSVEFHERCAPFGLASVFDGGGALDFYFGPGLGDCGFQKRCGAANRVFHGAAIREALGHRQGAPFGRFVSPADRPHRRTDLQQGHELLNLLAPTVARLKPHNTH